MELEPLVNFTTITAWGRGGVSGSKGKFKVGLIPSFAFAHVQYSGHLFAYVILDGAY